MRTKFNNRKREHYSDWIQSIIFGDSMTIRSFFYRSNSRYCPGKCNGVTPNKYFNSITIIHFDLTKLVNQRRKKIARMARAEKLCSFLSPFHRHVSTPEIFHFWAELKDAHFSSNLFCITIWTSSQGCFK